MAPLGKALLVFGLAIAALGIVLWVFSGVPLIGRLPGDIYIRRGTFTFYLPLTTCIVLSIVISILFALMRR
jgi:Protein of unknown function (DUF2905)